MTYDEMKIAYDEDLKKYGYVKQSTVNKFNLYQEPIPKKSSYGTIYLQKIYNDITEYWFIRNETVNTITWYIPQKPKKKKKKIIRKISWWTKKEYLYDSYIYHRIFRKYYWDINYCMICWSSDRLQIHHKDKNHKNNDISNLIKLCYKCHCSAHKWDKVYKLMIKKL